MKLIKTIALLIGLVLQTNISAQTWGTYSTGNGLLDNQVRCITSDSAGTVWIGTKTKGIQGFNGTSFVPFSKNSSLPTSGGLTVEITALQIMNGKMYIGVKTSAINGGLWIYTFATDNLAFIGTIEIIQATDILSFYKAKSGVIYCGTGGGFWKRVADNNWTRIGYGWCRSIAEKTDGMIYYTTFDSLYRYDGITKKGIKAGTFQYVTFDNNNVGYTSNLTDCYKFVDTTFTALGFGGYSKAMATDKSGKVWIASASGSFGLKSIYNGVTTTYTTASSPLLSADMTYLYVNSDNKKYVGHYSLGFNTVLDNAIVLPIAISPLTASMAVGSTQLFTGANGVRPYRWWVTPANLGYFDTSANTANFHAQIAGTGTVFISSAGGIDTARSTITIADTGIIIKLPPTGLTVSKGKYPNKIDISWTASGEFREGFEDDIPSNWVIKTEGGLPTNWVSSGFLPKVGTKCIKFDVYNPGTPVNDWLITDKIHVSPEKPTLTFWLKTAYAFGNPHSSYLKLSTTGQDTSSFTNTLREFNSQYLADSNLVWKFVNVDLTAYLNQDIYLAFKARGEDLIIYLDEMQLTGQTGLTAIGRAVQSYKLYRGATPNNIQTTGTVIQNNLNLNYSDVNITSLQNYYYAVSAVYLQNFETPVTKPSLGIAYAQVDSLVLRSLSTVTPVVDGVINASEYGDGLKTILTRNGYWADMYVKFINNKFYIAVDYFGDTTLATGDYLMFAFDKNRDYTYQDSVEGFYRVQKLASSTELSYFPYKSPFGFTQGVLNPTGFVGAVSSTVGHVQYEMSLDMATSFLNLPPNRKIGSFVTVYDTKNNLETSWLEKLLAKEYSIVGFGSMTFQIGDDVKENSKVPVEFALDQNYPNPFNPSTMIVYSVPERSKITLKVFDLMGKEVSSLINEVKEPGRYSVNFDASKLTSGIYFYRLESNKGEITKKLLFVK